MLCLRRSPGGVNCVRQDLRLEDLLVVANRGRFVFAVGAGGGHGRVAAEEGRSGLEVRELEGGGAA